MAIRAFSLFGEVQLKGGQQTVTGLRNVSGQVNITIKDLGRLRSEIDRTGKSQSNFSQGFLSSFGIQRGEGIGAMLGNATGGLIQSGAKMLFGHVTDAIQKGMDMKDLIEQTRIAFTNLTGSEQKAVEHMRELFKFGRDTPFKTRDLLDYSQQLQAVGVGYRDVKQELTDLGDAMAKAGTFKRMDKAIMAITQMRSKGRITGEELNQQLSEALPGARGYLARGLGVSQPELNKLLEENRLNAEEALKLMFMQMRLEAGGTMKATATKTLAGLESTLEDQKELLYAEAVAGGDPFGTSAGAYAQYMANRKKLIEIYGGPEAKQIAAKVGLGAKAYYGVQGFAEENAFNVSALSPALMLAQKVLPLDQAKQMGQVLGQYIPDGMKAALQEGAAGLKAVTKSVLGDELWSSLSTFWETNSPSKKTIQMGMWIREGLEIGLSKGQARNYANLQALTQADPEFLKTLGIEAAKRGVNPDDMLNLIAIESGFNKSVVNKFGYGGLGQVGSKERGELGLPVDNAAFKRMLEANSASWQLSNVLFPFLDMKLRANKGVKDDGISLAELYAMWGSGHATGDPNAIHMAKGGKRAIAYKNNPLWDFNKDGVVREGEYGNAAFAALGAGKFFSVNGQAGVSQSNPMPVQIIDAGNSVAIDLNTMQPLARASARPVFNPGGGRIPDRPELKTIDDPTRVIVDVTTALEPLEAGLTDIYQTTSLMPKPLQDVNAGLKEHSDLLDEMDALRKRAIKPEVEEKKKRDRLFDRALTREGIAGDFQGNLQGALMDPFSKKSWGNAGMGLLRDIQGRAAHDISSQLTGLLFGGRGEDGGLSGGLLSSLFGSLFGGKRGGGAGAGLAGLLGGGGSSGGGFLSKLFGSLFGGFRESGGSMSPGRFYLAGERGPEFVAGPGYVYNASQTRQMMNGGANGREQRFIFVDSEREAQRHRSSRSENFIMEFRRNRHIIGRFRT